jgi:hypothetical protein
MRNSVANKDHRGEAACDDREKNAGCDGVLHREGPQSKVVPATTRNTGSVTARKTRGGAKSIGGRTTAKDYPSA